MVSVQQILFAIFVLLSIVTGGVWWFKRQNLTHHLATKVLTIVKGWWMIFTVLSLASLVGKWGIWGLFLAISLYGVSEYLGISQLCQANKKTIRIFYGLGTLVFYLLLLFPSVAPAYMFAVVFQLLLSGVLLLQNKKREDIALTIAGGFGNFTLVVALSSVAQLVFLGDRLWKAEGAGVAALLILIFLTSLNDVFQFIGGKSFGRRKIVPHLSPNKTEAGFITGIIGTAVLASFLLHQFFAMSWLEGFGLGALIGLSGILGDLFLSAVKRSNGVKDFSDLIPGHGGLLDRLDSLIFTAPVFLLTLYGLFSETL